LAVISLGVWDIANACLLWLFGLRSDLARLPYAPASRSASWLAFRNALPLGISSLATWVYVKLDTILLGLTTDLATLGAYTAAVRLAELLGGLSTALNAVMLPAFARLSATHPENFRRARDAAITAVTFGIGLLCLGIFCFADMLVSVAFKLPSSSLYLQILVWGQIYAAAGVVCAVVLQVRGRGRSIAEITVLTSIISIPLYVVLIKIGGAVGAAVATVVSYALIIPIGLRLKASRTTFVPLLRASIVLLPAIAAGLGAFLYAGGFGGGRFGHAIIALLAYCVVAGAGSIILVRNWGSQAASAQMEAG
jgi:O-antigen/teichoic acid export membrane protein